MAAIGSFFVTGAASGIGRRIVERLLQGGHRVVASDIDEATLTGCARDLAWCSDRVRLIRLDVRDPEEWERAISEAVDGLGSIDCLMNVAGFLQPGYLRKIVAADVHRHFDINTKGVIFGTLAAARRMEVQGGGHIINMASIAGAAPLPGMSLYSASKYAVRGFSLAAAMELRSRGIHVTVVCPDGVRTPMMRMEAEYEESALVFSGSRVLEVDEVVDVILGRVLRNKPIEVFIPSSRGWLGRLADLLPGFFLRLEPMFRKRGNKMRRAILREAGRPE